jgi:hypothetical protein
MKYIKYFFVIVCFCVPSLLFADQYYSVSDPKTKKTIDCSYKSKKVEPGILKGTPPRFRSFMVPINNMKKKIERSTKKLILKKQLKVLQVEYSRLLKLCKSNLPADETPTPSAPGGSSTPTPTATPNRPTTPTPTPSSGGCQTGCFDSSRNTPCFNIPAPTKGNETRGFQLWASNCAGCHSESSKRNRVFGQISSSLRTVPQMLPFSDNFNTQDIADLVAYLNRFNTKQCRTDWP